jgi:CHAD domain-containing protein
MAQETVTGRLRQDGGDGMQEREAKLSAAPDFTLPDLADPAGGMVAEPLQARQLRTTYYDTPDLRLARWGLSLRYRTGEGWTVKLAGEGRGPLLVREELVFDGPATQPPEEAVDLVRAFVREAPLAPVARLRTTRYPVQLRDQDGQPLGELTDDRVAVLDGRRVSRRFREIETELASQAPDGALDGVIQRLRDAGAEPVKVASKYLQALGNPDPGPAEVLLEELDGHVTVERLVRYDLGAGVLRLFRHDPVVRLGVDPEGVHQARVATRRFRSTLRTFRNVLEPGWTIRLRERAKWLADRLGAVRDADVLLARLQARVDQLEESDAQAAGWLLERLGRERDTARSALLAAMREGAYVQLLDDLLAAASSPMVLDGGRPAAEALVPGVVRTWRKLRNEVRQAGAEPSDAQLHRIRIRAKRCRYAAEAVAPVAGKPAERFAAAVEAVQEVLGDQHDAVVAQAWLRQAAAEAPGPAALAAGLLIAAERDAAARARAQWEAAWERLDRKKLRSWL